MGIGFFRNVLLPLLADQCVESQALSDT